MKVINSSGLLSILVMAGMTFTLIGVSARADDNIGSKMMHGMQGIRAKFMDDYYSAINATPAQKTKMEALHKQAMNQIQPLMQSERQKRRDLMNYMASPGATREEAMRRQAEIDDLNSQINKIHLESQFQKKALLSPEQQQKTAAFMQEKETQWDKHMQEMKDKYGDMNQ